MIFKKFSLLAAVSTVFFTVSLMTSVAAFADVNSDEGDTQEYSIKPLADAKEGESQEPGPTPEQEQCVRNCQQRILNDVRQYYCVSACFGEQPRLLPF